ncbi:MAG: hypothetical protein ACRDI0_04915 [Actinomycetota bacterium]
MSELRVEAALSDLGRHLRYPTTPDLAGAVRARLERGPAAVVPTRRARRLVLVAAAVTALLVGGLAALSPAVRAALLRVFTLPGVRIEFGDVAPPAEHRPLGHGLDLGRRVTLEEAAASATFPIRVPEALGPPQEVYVDVTAGPARVSLVWGQGPGLPRATSTGTGALLSEFRATSEDQLIKKLVETGIPVEVVEVDGNPGYWVEGPHGLIVLDERGRPVEDSARLAGNTLLWSADGVTYRLETALDAGAALRIAGSLR